MTLNIPDRVLIENFTIENNVIKGIQQKLSDTYQIGQLLLDMFDSDPHHVSQIQAETEEKTTFMEMKENSIRCALWLKKLGIQKGDIITICTGNHLDAYIPIFATFYIGAIFNAWNNRISSKEIQRLMGIIKPKIIFVSEETAHEVIEAAKLENFSGKIIAYDSHQGLDSLKDFMSQQSEEDVKNFSPVTLSNPEDIAYIILSSGTTGFPKGVMHSYGNLVTHITTFLPYSIKGVVLWYSPYYWITGLMYSMQMIFNRGTRIIHNKFDPEETCKVIDKYKVEHILSSPISLGFLYKSNILNSYQLKSLKLIVAGGSKASKDVLEGLKIKLPHVTVCQCIGCSEVARSILHQTENCKGSGSVGYVMSNTEVKICDLETNKSLEANKSGELWVKTSAIMKGYYKNELETNAAIDDEGWLHTGDIAYYDENGEFFVVDRLKEIMKYQNYQVSPNEIEELVLSHPAVLEVSVVPIPHPIDGDHPVAFVRKSADIQVTEEELIKLSESLGELKKLHGGVKFVDEIPKTPAGKPNRILLKEWAKALA